MALANFASNDLHFGRTYLKSSGSSPDVEHAHNQVVHCSPRPDAELAFITSSLRHSAQVAGVGIVVIPWISLSAALTD